MSLGQFKFGYKPFDRNHRRFIDGLIVRRPGTPFTGKVLAALSPT
jgi:hypothetical protein